MMDWDKASKLLSEDLDKSIIKTRAGGGGKQLSYIDHFAAIDAANRIFGHGGWSRHTVHLRQISDKPIAYMAKVRITVGEVVRDGYGYGADPTGKGDHEKALKEAETDATKRALMTFGYPLGLALYQKEGEREHVSEVQDERANHKPEKYGAIYKNTKLIHPATPPGKTGDGPSAYSVKDTQLWSEVTKQSSLDELDAWWCKEETQDAKAKMPWAHQVEIFERFIKRSYDVADSKQALRLFLDGYSTELDDLKSVDPQRFDALYSYAQDAKTKFSPVDAGQ